MRKTEIFRKTDSIIIEPWGRRGYLSSGDALQLLTNLRASIADVVFLDPPFNLRKDYGIRSDLELTDGTTYSIYMESVLAEVERVLKPGGALFLYHLPYWAIQFASQLIETMTFRNWIAIAMKNGFVSRGRLYPAHYALLYFTKGTPGHFTRPKLTAAKCRHCDQLIKDYGGYTSLIERNGINLSDFWEDLSPVRHRRTKLRPANQLPVELTDRIIAMCGIKGGLLIDPFVGSGTSLVSAVHAGMNFVANDLSRRNLSLCRKRLRE